MLMITLPACPSIEEWAHVEAALALGQHVVLRAVDGGRASRASASWT
jgi:hypothetical protein